MAEQDDITFEYAPEISVYTPMVDVGAEGSLQAGGGSGGLRRRSRRSLAHQLQDEDDQAWVRRHSRPKIKAQQDPRAGRHEAGGGGNRHLEDTTPAVHAAPAHIEHMTEEEREMMHAYESLDYSIVQNELYRAEMREHDGVGPCGSCCVKAAGPCASYSRAQKWTIFALIGCITGIVAFFLSLAVETVNEKKFSFVRDYVHHTSKPLMLG